MPVRKTKDMSISKSITLSSPKETFELGKGFGSDLKPPAFIGLVGPLGAGKTFLAKSIASGLGYDEHAVHSPTFTLMNIYEARCRIYHFDFYRLEKPEEFLGLGLEEFFYDPDAVVIVEWADRVKNYFPKHACLIHLEFGKSETERIIEIENEPSCV